MLATYVIKKEWVLGEPNSDTTTHVEIKEIHCRNREQSSNVNVDTLCLAVWIHLLY